MMFADINSIVSTTYAVFGIIAIGGTGLLIVYVSRIRLKVGKESTTRQLLEESNGDLTKVHYSDQLTINQQKKEIELLSQNNEVLKQNYNKLEGIKTQAPSIIKMMKQSATQHQEIMIAFGNMTSELGNVAKAIVKERYGKR